MIKNDKRPNKKILVIDLHVPTPDRDSGSFRMSNLLQLLSHLRCQVTFAASNLEAQDEYAERLRGIGIEVLSKAVVGSIKEHLQEYGKTYEVVILSRVEAATAHLACVQHYAPQAFIIFDTVDLHFVREYRGAKVTGNMGLLKRALQTKRQELAMAQAADCTLVVSPAEKVILKQECPAAKVQIISNIHEVYAPVVPFANRKDILFIGSFIHHPNIDAVLYFSAEIFPLLKEKIPEIKAYIIGSTPPEPIEKLDSEDMIVTGYIPDVAPYFRGCKLSVAPLRYGAGVKGKVHLSLSYGLPVVASSIATEGMPAKSGWDIIIADNPEAMGQAIFEVYHDEILWNQLSKNGQQLINKHFSFEAAHAKLVELLR